MTWSWTESGVFGPVVTCESMPVASGDAQHEQVAEDDPAHVMGRSLRDLPRGDDVDVVACLQRSGEQLVRVAGDLHGALSGR